MQASDDIAGSGFEPGPGARGADVGSCFAMSFDHDGDESYACEDFLVIFEGGGAHAGAGQRDGMHAKCGEFGAESQQKNIVIRAALGKKQRGLLVAGVLDAKGGGQPGFGLIEENDIAKGESSDTKSGGRCVEQGHRCGGRQGAFSPLP